MTRELHAILSLAALFPLLSGAQEACPWLTAATAAGVLGGEVQTTVTHTETQNDTTCEFVRRHAPATYRLRIEVRNVADSATRFATVLKKCRSHGAELTSIGNEAATCSFQKNGTRTEEIVARVRDQAFIIRLSTGDRSWNSDADHDKAQMIAEQVAGNLF